MFLRLLIAFGLVAAALTYSKEICQMYCASYNGGPSYDNCSPWISYVQQNRTCYDLCVRNCAAKYDGKCMTDNRYRCCIPTFPAKTQQFKRSGCNKLYNNILD